MAIRINYCMYRHRIQMCFPCACMITGAISLPKTGIHSPVKKPVGTTTVASSKDIQWWDNHFDMRNPFNLYFPLMVLTLVPAGVSALSIDLAEPKMLQLLTSAFVHNSYQSTLINAVIGNVFASELGRMYGAAVVWAVYMASALGAPNLQSLKLCWGSSMHVCMDHEKGYGIDKEGFKQFCTTTALVHDPYHSPVRFYTWDWLLQCILYLILANTAYSSLEFLICWVEITWKLSNLRDGHSSAIMCAKI